MQVYNIIHAGRKDKDCYLNLKAYSQILISVSQKCCGTEEMDEVEMWPNHNKSETKNDRISNYYKNKFLVVWKPQDQERLEAENRHEQNLSAYFLIEHITRNWKKCLLRS